MKDEAGVHGIDVSIIVPVYNVERYLRASVESMLAQSHKNIEVILVDDGSMDDSPAICDAFAQRDARVRVIHKQNEGSGVARNTGMDAARGEYLYFCDSDDLIDPQLVAENLELARRHRADIVEFGYRDASMAADGAISVQRENNPLLSGSFDYQAFWMHFRQAMKPMASMCTKLFRTAYIRRYGLRVPAIRSGEDASFLYDAYASPFEKIVYNPRAYYTYIHRTGSASMSFQPKQFEDFFALSQRFEALIASAPCPKGRYDDLIVNRYVYCICTAMGSLARCTGMPGKEKADVVCAWAARPKIKEALAHARLGDFAGGTRVKVLLLRTGLVRLAVLLGDLQKRGAI